MLKVILLFSFALSAVSLYIPQNVDSDRQRVAGTKQKVWLLLGPSVHGGRCEPIWTFERGGRVRIVECDRSGKGTTTDQPWDIPVHGQIEVGGTKYELVFSSDEPPKKMVLRHRTLDNSKDLTFRPR